MIFLSLSWAQQSSSGMTSTASIYDQDYDYSVDIEEQDLVQAQEKKQRKTLKFLKELRNITKEAGDYLKLR